jgi:hypothetical protein
MKTIFALLAATALVGTVQAADIGVSVQVGQPDFYGRIDIGNTAPPPVVLAQPIWVQPAPVRPQPIYLRVPPGHQKHWDKHCREYNACGVPVYFVREDWYQKRYGHHDEDADHGKGHGKGHGKKKDHD